MYKLISKTIGGISTAFLLSSVAHAAPELTKLVDLDARVLVETRSIAADGVTHATTFEESVMRRGAKVWKLRLNLPQIGRAHV